MITNTELNILVVEDNPGDYDLVVEYLSEVNNCTYHLCQCVSLEDSEILLETKHIDVILLDLSLPDSVGINTISNMRNITSTVPIIVITGIDNDELGEQAIQQGAQEYLNKDELSGRMLARIIRYAIKRKKMDEKLEKLALTDPLTGLYNRRYFFERGWNEYVRARRYKHELAVFMVDLDYFKKINDNFGHAIGDKVLMDVAKLFSNTLRDVDLVARFGGEEFIVLIPETDQTGVEFLANRIREEVQSIIINHNGKAVEVSASLGVALLDEGECDFDELINRADTALYLAKDNGRNRVEFYKNDAGFQQQTR